MHAVIQKAARLAAVSFLLMSLALGQALPQPPDPPPGMVLVDDMWLPWDCVYGDSVFTATPWAGGIVPYAFDTTVSASNQTSVLRAMAEVEAIAQITFVPWSSQFNVIIIRVNPNSSNVSNSQVGMVGGPQFLSIGINHFDNKYTMTHEFFHAMGYLHEQSRVDRDTYVTINWANISLTACNGSCWGNFQKNVLAIPTGAYDFLSIMHYGAFAFAVNPAVATITCTGPYAAFQNQIGNRSYMTALDAQGMALRYGAPSSPAIATITPGSSTAGWGGFGLTVTGSGFFEGSSNSSGVQGSVVKWNGTTLATTYVNSNLLLAEVPGSLTQVSGTRYVRVDNDALAGGSSNSVPFYVNMPPCPTTNDRTGNGLAGIGDVDGDGRDDYVIGSPGYGSNAGRARCISGGTGAVLWSVSGGSGYQTGYAVADAGDLSGDGVHDVLVGSPGYSNWRGLVRGVNGQTGSVIRTIYGTATGDEFGWSVANAGDVNLDNVPDQVIGAPTGIGIGKAQIHSGANGGLFFVLTSPQAASRFASSVGGGYDMTGDDRPEVIVGAPSYDGAGGTDCGAAFVYAGAFGSLSLTREGDGANDYFGRSVAIIPSTTGGSTANAVVGASDYGNFLGNYGGTGYVRVFGGWRILFPYPVLWTWYGNIAGDRYGQAVAAAGDINDDGRMDVLIGAIQDGIAAGPAVGPGYVEIRAGGTGELLYSATGSNNGDQYGWTVAAAGDTDKDAVPDILVGTPFGDIPCPSAGSFSLLHPVSPPEQQKVMITEIVTDAPLFSTGVGIEITNFKTTAVNLAGWVVRWKDGATVDSAPLTGSIQPGEIILIAEPGATFDEKPPGVVLLSYLPSLSTGVSDFTVALVSAGGHVIDEVRVAGASSNVHNEGGLGGLFRGHVSDPQSGPLYFQLRAERIWGLDSNGGADWTSQGRRTMGLEIQHDGTVGFDPLPLQRVVINETDDSPDLIELRSRTVFPVNLQGWSLLCSAVQGGAHTRLEPFPNPLILLGSAFVVVGDSSTPPPELPGGIPYVGLSVIGSNIPWTTNEYDCALYDSHGRLVDLMRTTGHDDPVLHNHPRAPSRRSDFTGAAGRSGSGDGAIGRNPTSTDQDVGADFVPQPFRTMGSANSSGGGSFPNGATQLDVRINATGIGGGLAMILNAGPEHAGENWSFAFTLGHLSGTGPILGLGPEAIQNWIVASQTPPWFGILDARGAARVDLPSGSIPLGSLQVDLIFVVFKPDGNLSFVTNVLEMDI